MILWSALLKRGRRANELREESREFFGSETGTCFDYFGSHYFKSSQWSRKRRVCASCLCMTVLEFVVVGSGAPLAQHVCFFANRGVHVISCAKTWTKRRVPARITGIGKEFSFP